MQHPQHPQAGATHVPPPQPYYTAHQPAPGGPTYAYTAPPQQYGGVPPPPPVPGQPAYYAQQPHHPAPPQKVQPMETYAAPPSGGGPAQQMAGVEEEGQGKAKYQVCMYVRVGAFMWVLDR